MVGVILGRRNSVSRYQKIVCNWCGVKGEGGEPRNGNGLYRMCDTGSSPEGVMTREAFEPRRY